MVHAAHPIEEVGRGRATGRIAGCGLLERGRRVAHGRRDAAVAEPGDELERAGDLRRDRDEAQAVQVGLEVLVAQVGWGSEQGRVVGAALGVRQPRSLEIRAERLRPVGGRHRHPVADLVDEPVQVVERRRDAGRQERGHAVAQEVPRHPIERGSAAHRVVAAAAVHMDVDEARRDVRGLPAAGLAAPGLDRRR